MSRAKWKGPYISPGVLKIRFLPKINQRGSNILSWSRNSIIPGFLSNKKILVYNGRVFKSILINKSMVGSKLGEFSFTRSKGKPKKEKKTK